MSTESCKSEKGLCRCCHSEGSYKSIYERYLSLDIKEMMNNDNVTLVVYSDMLQKCFDIELAPITEPINHMLCTICDACIQRLRDATEFKHQIQDCERRFRDQYLSVISTDTIFEVDVKQEVLDQEGYDDVKLPPPESDHDGITDEDNDLCKWDNRDHKGIKVKDEEDFNLSELRKKAKPKKSHIATSTETKKKNVGLPKKASPPNDKKEDTSKDATKVKRPPPVQLKNGIDYKHVGDVFRCCRCEYENKNFDRTKYHVNRTHLKTPQYICSHCSKTFLTWRPFITHKLEEHNIDDRYKCNACDGVFNQKIQLRKHISSYHMLGEKYKCDKCDYESFRSEYIKKHKTKHENVKAFHCKFCRKSFKRSRALRLHEKIHTGDKRKVCKECGQAFVQKASLNYHMMKYHPEVNF